MWVGVLLTDELLGLRALVLEGDLEAEWGDMILEVWDKLGSGLWIGWLVECF